MTDTRTQALLDEMDRMQGDVTNRTFKKFARQLRQAIEAEARSTPAEALDVERLAARLLEGQKRQGGSVPLADENEARAYAAWLLGASDEEAAEYARLRSPESN